MNYKVDFINNSYRRFYSLHKEEIDFAIFRCLSEGEFILREDVKQFEKTLADYVGVKYAIGVNSGTDALFLSLKVLGIKEGDEVICPSHTFIASIQAIVHCGATPILVDVKKDGLIDTNLIEKVITSKTKAIMSVHLSGKVCNMKRLKEIADSYDLFVVEDACQALGASQNNINAGAFGDTGCFSFISPKSLGGISDGGAVVTDDKDIYEKLLLLRNHWNITQNALLGHQLEQPETMDWGWNSRLGNITAAFLNVKFKYYDEILKRRKVLAEVYNEGLKGLPLVTPSVQKNQIWSEYIVNIEDRWKFVKYLEENEIETLVRDVVPNHKLKGLGLEHFKLPITETLARLQVRLPIFPELTNEEHLYIIKIIRQYYGK